ncbi:MAG: branched-chain alpha-keto acid dehydrogenase subunit [Deltaproteobacteria bacterium]|nr:branched-chain alpha-keto acid dehydrogenase subunit [Deltaproteobacteria bacterium]
MSEFRMPSLGADMEAGTLVEWRVRPGDAVRRGDIVALVDTDKAVIEVEIWEDGVVDELLVAAGQKVPVGTPLARLRAAGATPPPPAPAAVAAPRPTEKPGAAPRAAEAAAAPPAPPASAQPPVAPAPIAVEAAAAAAATRRVHATPLARRIAESLGVDVAALEGTGPGGAVTRADVERAASPPRAAVASAALAPPAAELRAARARQAMAAAMARSKREIPHYYLTTRIDLAHALAWLAAENARRALADRLLPAALLLRAVALAAREAPEMNGFFVDGTLRPAACVHLGVGVSLRQGGLVAPTLRDADTKNASVVMRELTDLVARTRAGVLRSSELGDATLTVTNLGDQGAESVHGVIYPPQVALVGFGRIAEQPWAHDGFLGVRPVVVATLAADHRASDGHRGSRFLAAVDRLLQTPEKL